MVFGVELLFSLCSHVSKYFINKYSMKYHDDMNVEFYKKMSSVDISSYDSSTQRDKMTQAHKDMNSIEAAFRNFVSILVSFCSIIISIVIIFQLDFLLALAIFLSLVPTFFARKKVQERQYDLEKKLNKTNRKINYFGGLFWNGGVAPEMRLYNYSDFFLDKIKELYAHRNNKNLNLNKKNSILELICLLISGLINICYNVYIIILVIMKGLSVGDYNYYSTISGNFKGSIDIILVNVSTFMVNIKKAENYFEFMNMKNEVVSGTNEVPAMKTIEFVNVSFSYPDSNTLVLRNLNFSFNSGEKVALAGLNGAGKSTIIKLLFRLYDPTSGVILYNGIDIKSFDVNAYRRQFAAMLQDSPNFKISIRENVALSNIDNIQSDEKILKILSSVGLNYNDYDLDNQIGKDFDPEGVIMSKGQSQSLRLSKLFYKNCSFWIFDEPASNLDATVEKQIFENIFENCTDLQTIILISHRLSNLKFVDKIIFLQDGRVIESGSHKELFDCRGEYYRLYKIQSERY